MVASILVKPRYDCLVNESDQHYGKTAIPGRLGISEGFSTAIARDARKKLLQALAETTAQLRKEGTLGDLVINELGDGCEGSNMRPGQALRIDMSIGEQKTAFIDDTVEFVLAAEKMGWKRVRVRFTSDNHSRLGRKLDDDTVVDLHVADVARDVAHRLQSSQRSAGHELEREFCWYRLGNFTHYSEHGHRFKGGGKAHPANAAQNYVKERKELLGIKPNYVHFGHYHCYYWFQMTNGTTVIGSPSVPVGDDFTCNVINQAAGGAQLILPQHETAGIVNPRLVRFFAPRTDLAVEVI